MTALPNDNTTYATNMVGNPLLEPIMTKVMGEQKLAKTTARYRAWEGECPVVQASFLDSAMRNGDIGRKAGLRSRWR